MTDHPEFPDQTSESYLVPREQFDAVVEENERLRTELADCKPDWDIAPNWARYLARDITGKWHWYAAEPKWCDGYWDSSFASEVAWLSASNEPEEIPQ